MNGDGRTDAFDVDTVCGAVHDGQAQFDFNRDGQVDLGDFEFFVGNVLRTHPGDANVDSVFDSADLVDVFRAGEYEDEMETCS